MDQLKIGAYLKELRKDKAITQEQLADILNVSRRTVSRWETGSNLPDLDLLIELADFYKVDLRQLLEGEANPEDDAVSVEVMNLPIRLREVVLLYYFEDMNTNEIAETLRISQQAVSGRLMRARAKLRKALGNEERGGRNG